MEQAVTEKQQVAIEGEKKRERKWGNRIFHFLVYGGWLLVLVLFLAVWILIAALFK